MNETFREHCKEKINNGFMHRMNYHRRTAASQGLLFPIVKSLFVFFAATTSLTAHAEDNPLFATPFSTTYNNTTLSMPYRIPALVETVNANGEKELIYFGDKRHCGMDIGRGSSANDFHPYYRVDIVARRSTNGGANWTAEETIQQGNASCGYGDVAVVSNHENPKEIMFMAATGNVSYGDSEYNNPLKTTRFYSNDGGSTWTTTDMTSSVYSLIYKINSSMTALFFTSGRICQSKQIKVGEYYRIYSALCVRINGRSNAFVVYSDDFGANWNVLGGGIAVSDGDESKIEELPNGNVLISSRIYSGYDDDGRRRFNVFNYSSLPTSANTANGSWGTYYSGIQYTGTVKPCNGEILLVPAQDASGNSCNILLHSEPYGTTTAEGRGNVSIFWKKLSGEEITSASEFSGTNWNRYPVSTTTSAYSTMILQHDGTIAFAYEENIWGKGWEAPTASCNHSTNGWTELGYDLMYQNFTLAEITDSKYSYYAGEEEEGPVVETVATPAFSLAEGEYEGSATVEITCTTDGATIYYTLDGSTPTTASAVYGGAITLTESATVSAIAVLDGYNDSEVATATYTIKTVSGGDDDEPTSTVTKYRFKNVQKGGNVYYFKYAGETDGLTLTTTESEATLYTRTVQDAANGIYNFQSEDGNYLIWTGRDMSSNTGYNSGLGYYATYNSTYCDLTISEMVSGGNVESFSGTYYTVKGLRLLNSANAEVYFVIKNGGTFDGANSPFYNSNYSSAFVIEEVEVEVEDDEVVETVDTPVISPAGGEYTGTATVSITCATDGATIYYTVDGTAPSASNGTAYAGAFTLDEVGTYTVKAIAVKDGCTDSEVVSASFIINEEVVEETVEWPTTAIECSNEGCSSVSYSTLYLDHAVKIPSGVNAYRGVLDTENAVLTLYRIKTGVIPNKYAVVIENLQAGSSVTFTKTSDAESSATNDLKGSLVDTEITNTANYYVLGHTDTHHIGFYHPNSTILPANKAYIEWANTRSLTVRMGDATALEEVGVDELSQPVSFYNLTGSKVEADNLTPGIYIRRQGDKTTKIVVK